LIAEVSTVRVTDEAARRAAVNVLAATYHREKGWVSDADRQFPSTDLGREEISWFLANIGGRPAGVLRIFYDPPIAEYARSGFTILESAPAIEDFLKSNRIAEVGRFAVLPEHRGNVMVAAALIRAALAEPLDRGCSHLVTDVFEDDPHSPLGFHTRVMGFYPVATHEVGALRSQGRRITLLLDLEACYRRMNTRRGWLCRYLIGAWSKASRRPGSM
jgi:hypothetical protein